MHVRYDDLAQDCSNSIANTLELLPSCAKSSNLHIYVSSNLNFSTESVKGEFQHYIMSGNEERWYRLSFLYFFGKYLTHLPLNKMASISQTIFSNAFSWMKSFVFWFKFHWNLFLRVQLTIIQHWFR